MEVLRSADPRRTAIRDRDEAGRWLAAGMCLMRIGAPTEMTVRRVGPWILAAMGERLDLPPVGVIADIGGLLLGGSLASSRERTRLFASDVRLESAIRRYEDGVLGRLSAGSRLVAVGDAIAKLPADLHAEAVGILVAGILRRAGFQGGTTLQPGLARAATERSAAELIERGFTTVRDDVRVRAMLADGYEALVAGAERARQLISDADVFALENLTVLRSFTQRLAIAQVVEAQEALTLRLPARIRSTRSSTGDAATKLEDESAYPIGGFSSMSTAGSLENLVTSELIYMDAPSADGQRSPVDLFDMRYVEGELLYYTRDEAIFVRQRRVVVFLLGDELTATRVKDPSLPWQRIVLVLGLLLATVKKLTELLGTESLFFRVAFVRDEGYLSSKMKAERELCELALREWRDKGMAEVIESTLREEAVAIATLSRRALVQPVVFTPALSPADENAIRGKSDAHPVHFSTGIGAFADFDSWSQALVDLLAALV